MFYQKVRKVGNSLVVTLPKEEADRLGVVEGDMVALHVNKAELKPQLSPEIQAIMEESWKDHKEGYLYLKGR